MNLVRGSYVGKSVDMRYLSRHEALGACVNRVMSVAMYQGIPLVNCEGVII